VPLLVLTAASDELQRGRQERGPLAQTAPRGAQQPARAPACGSFPGRSLCCCVCGLSLLAFPPRKPAAAECCRRCHAVAPRCTAEAPDARFCRLNSAHASVIMPVLIRGSLFWEESMFNTDPGFFQRALEAQVSEPAAVLVGAHGRDQAPISSQRPGSRRKEPQRQLTAVTLIYRCFLPFLTGVKFSTCSRAVSQQSLHPQTAPSCCRVCRGGCCRDLQPGCCWVQTSPPPPPRAGVCEVLRANCEGAKLSPLCKKRAFCCLVLYWLGVALLSILTHRR